jgi:hypothetical protein
VESTTRIPATAIPTGVCIAGSCPITAGRNVGAFGPSAQAAQAASDECGHHRPLAARNLPSGDRVPFHLGQDSTSRARVATAWATVTIPVAVPRDATVTLRLDSGDVVWIDSITPGQR